MAPQVQCVGCGRRVDCAVMKDGTVYRPFAWEYTDGSLSGTCANCQAAREAERFLAAAVSMHESDPSRTAASIVTEYFGASPQTPEDSNG